MMGKGREVVVFLTMGCRSFGEGVDVVALESAAWVWGGDWRNGLVSKLAFLRLTRTEEAQSWKVDRTYHLPVHPGQLAVLSLVDFCPF